MVQSTTTPAPPGREEAMTDRIVRWLSRPGAYPDRPAQIKVVETHISWVFLTERHAYKLKKPVHFEFVDFREPSRRHEACQAEVDLNRRLAPDVYLGVVPVTCDRRGCLTLDAGGVVVDWLVKMRRLPDDRSLEAMLQHGTLTRHDVCELSETLTDFYQRLPPLTIRVDEYHSRLLEHVRANLRTLADEGDRLPQPLVQRAHQGQLRVLNLQPELVDDRAVDGRIVEGHGDLRPDHIYFVPRPTIIDCVEFSRELRQLDVLDELSFLAMECDYRGSSDVGQRIIQRYCQASRDLPPSTLIAFYKSYRASVHAKVASLRADQRGDCRRSGDRRMSERYLQLAATYAAELGPSLLLIMHGLAGTGKSTVASELADRLNLIWLRTDAIRQQTFPGDSDTGDDPVRRYRLENRERVYDEILRRAEGHLADGLSVILDGTFLAVKHIRAAADLALRHNVVACVLDCQCSESVAEERIVTRLHHRDSVSEATPQLYRQQQKQAETIPADVPVCILNTEEPLPAIMTPLRQFLRRHTLPQP